MRSPKDFIKNTHLFYNIRIQNLFYQILLKFFLKILILLLATTNPGKVCSEPLLYGDCKLFNNCTTCVQAPGCNWCDNMCLTNKTCSVNTLLQCPISRCIASDCVQCYQEDGCYWNGTVHKCQLCK